MTVYGSVLPAFKRALIDLLAGFVDNASYQSPTDPSDMLGADGTAVCAWWDDAAEAEIEVAVATGGPHFYDERLTLTLVIQALGRDTDDTQEVCDQKASVALGHLITLLQDDPTAGIANTGDLIMFGAVAVRNTYQGGVLGTSLRAASYKVDIEIHSRITLEL